MIFKRVTSLEQFSQIFNVLLNFLKFTLDSIFRIPKIKMTLIKFINFGEYEELICKYKRLKIHWKRETQVI